MSTKPNLINYSEWIAEIERLKEEEPQTRGLTRRELAEHYGHGEKWVSQYVLQPLMAQGRLQVSKRRTIDVSGKACIVPEYLPRSVSRETKKTG